MANRLGSWLVVGGALAGIIYATQHQHQQASDQALPLLPPDQAHDPHLMPSDTCNTLNCDGVSKPMFTRDADGRYFVPHDWYL